MSEILSFQPSPSSGVEQPGRRRLRRAAGYATAVLTATLVAVVCFTLVVLTLGLPLGGSYLWLGRDAAYLVSAPSGIEVVPFSDLPTPTRWAYAASFILSQGAVLAVLTRLRGLVAALCDGIVFTTCQVSRLRSLAALLVACAATPACGQALVRLVGGGVDTVWFRGFSVHALILAGIVVLLADVFEIGRDIQTDRDGFV